MNKRILVLFVVWFIFGFFVAHMHHEIREMNARSEDTARVLREADELLARESAREQALEKIRAVNRANLNQLGKIQADLEEHTAVLADE